MKRIGIELRSLAIELGLTTSQVISWCHVQGLAALDATGKTRVSQDLAWLIRASLAGAIRLVPAPPSLPIAGSFDPSAFVSAFGVIA